MAYKTLQLRHSFHAQLSEIYDYLLDFKKFGTLHPYMVSIKELSSTPPNRIEYEVREEALLLGFLKMQPIYKAEVIEIEPFKQIQYLSRVKGGIKLIINFTFEEDKTANQVSVLETIEVTGNSFLITYFLAIVKKTHLQLFDNLRREM